MAKSKEAQPLHTVSVYDDPTPGSLRFTFVPRGLQGARGAGGPPQSPPEYIVSVQGHGEATTFTWINSAPNAAVREVLETEARDRVTARHEWLERLGKLVKTVKAWAESLEWSAKIVSKKMTDSEIGTYKAPALVLQDESVKLYLEPVARSAPGTEGVIDLCIMPSYDDVASLYYYNNQWNVHYMFQGTPSVGNIRNTEAKQLTKATLKKVFDEMKANAS